MRDKFIPACFLKVEGRGTLVGAKKGWLVELVGDHNPGPEALPKSKRGGNKEEVRGGATASGAMEKSRYVRIIEGEMSEEMTQSNTYSPRGSEVPFEYQRG